MGPVRFPDNLAGAGFLDLLHIEVVSALQVCFKRGVQVQQGHHGRWDKTAETVYRTQIE